MGAPTDARVWLRANGYEDIADQIDSIMAGWREREVSTRRDWWEALAGTKSGKPRVVEGVVFPVLAAVRARENSGGKNRNQFPPVATAIERTPGEVAPPKVKQARWPSKRRSRKR